MLLTRIPPARRHAGVAFITPLGGPNSGGVQASARLAWQALALEPHWCAEGTGLLVYGEAEPEDLALASRCQAVAANRSAILRNVLSRRWTFGTVLFWHLGLLKVRPLLRAGRARTVLFLHGIEAWRRPGWLLRRLLRRVDLFLSNSAFTWQRFLEFNPELAGKPHRVVHLGCEVPVPEAPPPEEPPAVLMLGRLARGEDYKGHRELIAAWPRVRARVPHARLWIAGDGDLRPDLEALAAAHHLADAVRFWGRVSEREKEDLLRRCRCFAMPSRGEGFGLVYLEAMRLGRPCLVSNCDAAREVVHPPEAGLAVDPGDTAAVADAVVRLLTPGAVWETWSAAARNRYASHFTARDFQRRLVEALAEPAGR